MTDVVAEANTVMHGLPVGDWEVFDHGNEILVAAGTYLEEPQNGYDPTDVILEYDVYGYEPDDQTRDARLRTAEFVAAAHTLIPRMATTISEQRTVIEQLRTQINQPHDTQTVDTLGSVRNTAESVSLNTVTIFTDGACHGNPGPGGWGAVLRTGTSEEQLYGGEENTTNNRMEILAAIKAIEALGRPHVHVELWTDSQYLRNGITSWIKTWRRKGWKTSTGQPVKNLDLWQRLDAVAGRHTIDWRWIKGHAGHEGNELADKLATRGAIECGGSTHTGEQPRPTRRPHRRRR
uniref:Ribonuclease H n=1 Tax=Mycolicibacterium sp. CBMA 213 TaxID=1968788 RepID=A0A343VR55_9MYCO|nr:Ribonuclease HI [Mycolicibacterium sp. CBMA 213]